MVRSGGVFGIFRAGLLSKKHGYEILTPADHIVFADRSQQFFMTLFALRQRHFQRALDSFADVLDRMRIDEQCVGHLQRGAGELRQDQHAGIFRILRGHIFLGDQVHAIAQAA